MTGGSRPTLTDVASLSGVSAATVSRALARPHMVNRETLARVLSAADRLGYVPAGAARALASGRSKVIGAIVPTLDSAIFSRTLQALQGELAAAGYGLIVASNDYNPAAEAGILRALLAQAVDGLVLVGAERSPEATAIIRRAGVPVVLTWCGHPAFDAITVDNCRAGRLAAEHLVNLGHRAVGVVTGTLAVNDRQRQRVAGIRDALEAHGLTLPEWHVMEQPFTLAGGRSGCAALLSLQAPPTAIICGIDLLAVGCLAEAHARGLRVPGDLSVVGIDNLDMAAHVSPALTTVHVPTARIGEMAALTLLERLNGCSERIAHELAVELVVRQSTGEPERFALDVKAVREER
jgi:LacI family transcriptional regulator